MKKYNIKYGLKSSKFLKLLPVSKIRLINIGTKDRPIWKNSSDVTLLFNQHRILESLGIDTVRNWLASMGSPQSFSTAGFTDEQLLSFVKSRYVQAPSDMLKWSKWLSDNMERNIEDFQNVVRTTKKQQDYFSRVRDTLSNPKTSE